jgi:hypothetical protein
VCFPKPANNLLVAFAFACQGGPKQIEVDLSIGDTAVPGVSPDGHIL